jgi:hypothetical protein
MQKVIIENYFHDEPFTGRYGKNGDDYSVTFNYKRIKRLKFERASGLLTQYFSVLQRPALDPDYGITKKR